VGGAPCLDFANSVDWDENGSERSHTDALPAPTARARALRRAVHDVFAAIAVGEEAPATALRVITRHYAEATRAAKLIGSGTSWELDWAHDDPRRERFAAAQSAVDLLRDDAQLARVRICPGDDCGWLFLDSTGRRRWCSMEVCGSRAKMRRMYARQRSARR
jgi:predicted RNA-binding Zn ribbon-like protein